MRADRIMIASITFLLLGSWPGDATISARFQDSEIRIRTEARFAGTISSLNRRGVEFVDAADHGREIQSASNLDTGSPILPETFNPTEAGSTADGDGPTSSSEILRFAASGDRLESTVRMAFWLRPGERSGPVSRRTRPRSATIFSRSG